MKGFCVNINSFPSEKSLSHACHPGEKWFTIINQYMLTKYYYSKSQNSFCSFAISWIGVGSNPRLGNTEITRLFCPSR